MIAGIMETKQKLSDGFKLTSTAFKDGGPIPVSYTCKGENISPPLSIADPPEGTQSFALIMHDPDAPAGDWVHWTAWNINAEVTSINKGEVPDSAEEGLTSFATVGYGGPCPPSGTHRYVFELYALDSTLELMPDTTREQLKAEVDKHIIGRAVLTGLSSG